MRRALIVAWMSVGSVVGCDDRGVEPVGRSCEITHVVPIEANRKVDLLLVIDESPRMAQEQASLAVNVQRFAAVLENIEGGLPDLHLAVISADLARDGRFQHAPRVDGCRGPSDLWLSDVQNRDGTRTRNYDGSFTDALECIAQLGASGGTFSQPLAAMRRALDGTHPDQAGFLRAGAFLAIIFITDQDDCSANEQALLGGGDEFVCAREGIACRGAPLDGTPGAYAACVPYAPPASALTDLDEAAVFAKSLKADADGMVMVAGVLGNPAPVVVTPGPALAPSCSTASAEATPSIRLEYFLRQFPDRNTLTSICNEDLSDAFTTVAQLLARTLGNPCLEGVDLMDLDPLRPGLQLECTVADVKNRNTSTQVATPLGRCELDGRGFPVAELVMPCWWVTMDPVCTYDGPGLLMHIERAADPPLGTTVVARCAAARCD